MDEQHVSEEAPAGTPSFAGLADRMMNACGVEVSAEAFRGELLRSEMELVGALYGVIWHPRRADGKLDAMELAAGVGAEAVQLWRIPLSKLAMKVLTEGGYLVRYDGKVFRIYGTRRVDHEGEAPGRDLYVWTSTDGGNTWDSGRCLVDHRRIGRGIRQLNLVAGYSGSGPFLIFEREGGPLPKGYKITPKTHYDNPSRWGGRICAIDGEGNFLPAGARASRATN